MHMPWTVLNLFIFSALQCTGLHCSALQYTALGKVLRSVYIVNYILKKNLHCFSKNDFEFGCSVLLHCAKVWYLIYEYFLFVNYTYKTFLHCLSKNHFDFSCTVLLHCAKVWYLIYEILLIKSGWGERKFETVRLSKEQEKVEKEGVGEVKDGK